MRDPIARIAAISLHTSPLDQPGTGDSGGMNVSIRSVAEGLADRGVAVDVFTRCAGRGVPEVERIGPLTRIVQVNAGPCAPLDKDDLLGLLPWFEEGILSWAEQEAPYDLVHAHYWLSGRVGMEASARWGVPLVVSFHTLGAVKNRALARLGGPEPATRLRAEREAIAGADRVLVPTPAELDDLVRLYGAAPERARVVPPGVDTISFAPRPKHGARRRLGLPDGRVLLFVGRLQPLKGPDVAIRAAGEGLGDRVVFLDPMPHEELPWAYSAADVLLMPSRTESFGLAALEAQACSVPVVAASVGGLRHVVVDGVTGFLVEGHEPGAYADRLLATLSDPAVAPALGSAGRRRAAGFGWDESTDGVLDVYAELLPELAEAPVA